MRTIKDIITDLKTTLYWSKPNIKYNEFVSLIDELEKITSEPVEPKVEKQPKKTVKKTTPKVES